jgi:hypothetical protein
MYRTAFAVIGLVAALGAAHVRAQKLDMVSPPAAEKVVAGPARGLSMAQVERAFGEPSQRYAAVGEPPITRWVYPQFVVYFEHSHVIHAVAKRDTPSSG